MKTGIKNLVMSDRPSVFVASSSEGRVYAEAVQHHLAPHADVDVWTDDVFRLNRAYLDTLLDSAGFYDYAIAVMTPDDDVTVRGELGQAARDNVVFEYGLFLGRLGPARAFALKEHSVRVFSDFAGIEVATFVAGPDPVAATGDACRRILGFIAENEQNYEVGFLPSTALALGYYHNFLGRLVDALLDGEPLWVTDPDAPSGQRSVDYDRRRIRITVLLPKTLADLEDRPLKAKTRKLTRVTLKTSFRPFPFYIEGDIEDDPLELFDIPTTLRASRHAIEATFSDRFLRDPAVRSRIERREISNFEKTLRLVLPDALEDVTVIIMPLDAYAADRAG